jgi:heme A synthase
MVVMLLKRRATEAPDVVQAAVLALGLVAVQIVVAASMILMHLPPLLRSLHEATGVAIWLATFTFAYLAQLTSGELSLGLRSAPSTLDPRSSPLLS